MKKNITLIILAFIAVSYSSYAQSDWNISSTSAGNYNITSKDGKYKFTPGGRFTIDGGYLQEDITPLASGTVLKEARMNFNFKIDDINIRIEMDFAKSKVAMKDIIVSKNLTDHSFIKIGHFVEPFSPNFLTTTEKVQFIGRPTMASAFAPVRNLGLSYRHYQKKFWFEGGVFGDDINQTYKGKDGYAFTGRFVFIPIEIPHSHLHIGVSGSFRRSDSRGLDDDGSGYFNRKLNFTAGLQNSIHTDKFLEAFIGPSGTDSYGQNDLEDLQHGGAKNQVQLDFEIMDIYRNFYWQVEFIHTRVNRVMNKEKILFFERDGGTFPETWEDISYKYGEARPLNFYGYYAHASYLIFGGEYKYQRSSATVSRLTKRALEASIRYDYTNLNDVEGEYIGGEFYTIDEGRNQSEAGGITKAFSASLNYIYTANIRFVFDYTRQEIDNYLDFEADETINIFQARVQVQF